MSTTLSRYAMEISNLETFHSEEENALIQKSISVASLEIEALVKKFQRPEDFAEAMHDKYIWLVREFASLEIDIANKLVVNKALGVERDALLEKIQRYHKQRVAIEQLAFDIKAENKQVSEESARLVALEQQKRETLSRKFEVIIADIKIKLDADLVLKRTLALETKKSEQLIQSQIDEIEVLNETINRSDFEHREEVAAITKRLVEFIEQYELREVHFASVNQTRSLAYQFTAAKVIAQSDSNENLTQAKDTFSTRAGQTEALNSVGLKRKEMVPFVEFPNSAEIARHEHIERGLKEQLLVYVEKFNKVELTLQKSDTLFKTLRNEMQRTNLKTLALERENTGMKLRFESMSSSMTTLVDDKASVVAEMAKTKESRNRLEALCRALQSERATLTQSLKVIEQRLVKHFGERAGRALLDDDDIDQLPDIDDDNEEDADDEEEDENEEENKNCCDDTHDGSITNSAARDRLKTPYYGASEALLPCLAGIKMKPRDWQRAPVGVADGDDGYDMDDATDVLDSIFPKPSQFDTELFAKMAVEHIAAEFGLPREFVEHYKEKKGSKAKSSGFRSVEGGVEWFKGDQFGFIESKDVEKSCIEIESESESEEDNRKMYYSSDMSADRAELEEHAYM